MKQLTSIITITLVLLSFNALCIADDYYVNAGSGLDTNSGLYVDDAWKTITHALTGANPAQNNPAIIHIAAGTYNMAIGETFPLTMDNDIQLIGADRTITIIDATGSGTSVIYSQYAQNVKIEGLTITGGEGTVQIVQEKEVLEGGGFFLETTTIDIDNCIIKENEAVFGGGIRFARSTLNLTNCEIRDNKVIQPDEESTGGGIFGGSTSGKIENCIIKNNSANVGGGISCGPMFPPIGNCQIIDNTATRTDGGGIGGGISCIMTTNSISNSNISNNKSNSAGGIYSYKSSTKITSCIIENNQANEEGNYGGYGGGISTDDPQLKTEITDCSIIGNQSAAGGGIYCQNSSPKIKSCQIINNSTTSTRYYTPGGGICCMGEASPSIDDCLIKENEADYGGGIMSLDNSSPVITNSKIENNTANKYGGAFHYEDGSLSKIINCLIINNYGKEGGSINSYNASPKFNLCTIAGNTGNYANGFYAMNGGNPSLTSCILWNNDSYQIRGPVIITYSDVEYGYEGDGNIKEDPLFATGPWGDYYLSCMDAGENAESPCRDAGSEMPIFGFNPKEYITRCDGVFDYGRVDMGYHSMPHVQLGLAIDPVKMNYTDGDQITLRLNLKTPPTEITADLYFIMHDPDGNFWTCLSWNQGIHPLVSGFKLPANLDIEASPLVNFTLPSTTPPIDKSGTYTFYLAALKPGTADFISIIASTGFTVH